VRDTQRDHDDEAGSDLARSNRSPNEEVGPKECGEETTQTELRGALGHKVSTRQAPEMTTGRTTSGPRQEGPPRIHSQQPWNRRNSDPGQDGDKCPEKCGRSACRPSSATRSEAKGQQTDGPGSRSPVSISQWAATTSRDRTCHSHRRRAKVSSKPTRRGDAPCWVGGPLRRDTTWWTRRKGPWKWTMRADEQGGKDATCWR
jgi:hypothetical protein